MSIHLDIKLRKVDKIYHVGVNINHAPSIKQFITNFYLLKENISGLIVLETNSDLKHDGITLTMEGSVNLQVSSKNVGILEAFYNAIKVAFLKRAKQIHQL